MKKIFLWMSVALVGLFTSCSEEAIVSGGQGDVETTISITVPEGVLATRAAVEGSKHFEDPVMAAMRVALIVSNEEGKVLNIYQFDSHDFGANGSANPANFKIRFVKGQKYNITAWADFGAAYYTLPSTPDAVGNLYDAVVTAPTTRTGSLNTNDCYFKNELIQLTENKTINLVLKRPVALVKVNTKDWNFNEVKYANFRPDFYQVKVTAPTSLNLISGVADNPQEITCSAQIVEYNLDGEPKEMHYDYFFANNTSAILPAFTVNYYKGGQVQTEVMSDFTFENIPVQRNYKTNITGNILTKLGDINVTIDNTWYTPDYEIFIREVNTPSETYNDLRNYTSETTGREYVIQSASSTDNTIVIPDETQAASLTYTLQDLGNSNEITVEDETPGTSLLNYPNEVTIQVPDGANPTVYVNTQSAHVTVVGDANVVYANTSQNTFVVAEGSTVTKIVAQKGNIEIHGTVTDIVRDADNKDAKTYVDIYGNGVWTNEAQNQDAKIVVRRPVAKIGETIYLSMEDALAAAKTGDEIIVTAATVAMPAVNKSNVTVKSTIATKVTSFGGVAKAYENVTIDGFEFTCTAGYCQGKNLTLKNCKFTGEFGLRWSYANTLMTIESCEFAQTGQYGIHFDGANGSVVVNNSKIKGTVAVAATLPCITFNKCEFAGRSNSGHCNINIYNKGVFNECTFTADYASGQSRGILMLGDNNNASVELVNCAMTSDDVITDIFRRDYIQGLAEINAEKNAEGKFVAGTFVAPDAALIATASGYAALSAGNNVYNVVENDSWLAFAAKSFASIDKSAKTITIATAEQLALLALNGKNGVNYGGYTITLTDDIDLDGHNWHPIHIWDPENPFTFDGGNKKISNLTLIKKGDKDAHGLFDGITGNIKNLTVDNASVTAYAYTGVVVGQLYGNMENVHVTNSMVTGEYWGVSGLIGFHNSGNLKDCSVEGVTVYAGCPGAMVGVYNETANRTYENCTATNCILNDICCWGAPYTYGSIVAVVNVDGLTFKGCSSSNMTYYYKSTGKTYHSGEEGTPGAPLHALYGGCDATTPVVQ